VNRSTNRYRWYNNYSATRLRITCGDHDKRRNWFEDYVCDRAVNDKSKCVDSEVRDTVRCLYVSHVHMCTHMCIWYTNVVFLMVTILLCSYHSHLHIPISLFQIGLIKRLRNETCFIIFIFFVILL